MTGDFVARAALQGTRRVSRLVSMSATPMWDERRWNAKN